MKHNFIPRLLTVSVTLTQFSFGQSQSVVIFHGHGGVGPVRNPDLPLSFRLPKVCYIRNYKKNQDRLQYYQNFLFLMENSGLLN
jgi:hypothetical protein